MKKLLTIVLALVSLLSYAQTYQNIRVRLSPSSPVLYNIQAARDTLVYQRTNSGLNSFTAAVARREIAATITCPCGERPVVAVGAPFPSTSPCSANCTTTPSWASSWYDYNGSLLSVRATGEDMLLRFERQDGQSFSLTNPDNVPINNQTFYDHATLAGNVYQWQVNFANAPPLKLTYKRKSDNSTYTTTFTPAVNASNVQLFQASSGGGGCDFSISVNSPTLACNTQATITATASGTGASGLTYSWTGPNGFTATGASIIVQQASLGTYSYQVTATKASTNCSKNATAVLTVNTCGQVLAYNRVLVVANSIGYYPAPRSNWPGVPRGMAATAPEKDFVHLLQAKLQASNSAVQVRTFVDFASETNNQINESTGPIWESAYWTTDLSKFDVVAAWKPDLIVMRVAENVLDPTHNFLAYYLALIDKLKSQSPNAKIVLTPSVWGQTEVTNAIAQAAAQRGYPYANSLASMWTYENDPANPYYAFGVYNDAGVSRHPDDDGMQRIADEIYAKIPTNNPSNPGTGNPPPFYTYNYPTVEGVAPWPNYNSKVINGHLVGPTIVRENQFIKIEVRSTYGGAIQITDKATGRDLVNFHDHGRESEIFIYGGPKNFSAGTSWPGIGWNPALVGDDGHHGSPVEAFGLVTGNDGKERIYTKTHTLSWPHGKSTNVEGARDSRLLEAWIERWILLENKGVDVQVRVTFNRTDLGFYDADIQEFPNFMVPGHQTNMRYSIRADGSITTTTTKENSTTSFQQTAFNITQPFAAVEYDQAGHHIFAWTDKLAKLTTAVYVPEHPNEWGEEANANTYCALSNQIHVDPQGTWYHQYGFYVTDNFEEGRAWANSKPKRYGNVPDFRFTAANGRNDWNIAKGTDQREPFASDGWKTVMVPSADQGAQPPQTPTARRSYVVSPVVIHRAADVPKIYIRMKYSGSQTQLALQFRKNGQREGGLDSSKPNEMAARFLEGLPEDQQYFLFNVIPDGQFHTYEINTSSNGAWNNIIQQYKLSYKPSWLDGSVIPQENWEISYFGVNNPGN